MEKLKNYVLNQIITHVPPCTIQKAGELQQFYIISKSNTNNYKEIRLLSKAC